MSTKSPWPDLLITVPIMLFLSLGILVIYSSDPRLAIQQTLIALVGLVLFFVLSSFDFQFYGTLAKPLYFVTLALLVVVFVLGLETRGSLRWVVIGDLRLQPSELAKPVLIICLAKFWSSNHSNWKNILKSLLLVLPMAGLIFKQPDLGTTLTIMVIWLFMLIGANISYLKLFLMAASSALLLPLSWSFLKEYQKVRILSFISPDRDPLGMGYNAIQSTIAVGSGGLFGRGLGRGTQSRLQFLPEFRTDFIFASIAEELGFVACVLVLILYGTIISRALKIISEARSKFGSLLIFGVLGMLFFQIVVNIGMNIGILPITGITLPLLSYGGSSLLTTLISLSFITSVAKFGGKKSLEED